MSCCQAGWAGRAYAKAGAVNKVQCSWLNLCKVTWTSHYICRTMTSCITASQSKDKMQGTRNSWKCELITISAKNLGHSRNQLRTKHKAALKVKIWLLEREKLYGLCEQWKIKTTVGFSISWQDCGLIHYFWPSYCFLKIFIPLGRIAFHVTCSTVNSVDRKGERVVGQPYNSTENWFPLTKTGQFSHTAERKGCFPARNLTVDWKLKQRWIASWYFTEILSKRSGSEKFFWAKN